MPKQIRTATKSQWLYNSWVAEIKILKDTDLKKKYKRKNKREYVYTGIWWLVSTWNNLYIFLKYSFCMAQLLVSVTWTISQLRKTLLAMFYS